MLRSVVLAILISLLPRLSSSHTSKCYALTRVAWVSPDVSLHHDCPDAHRCCQSVAAQPSSAPLYVDLVHAKGRRHTFVLTRNGARVRTSAFATGTGPGRYDATNLSVRMLQALYPDGDLRANASVPWRLFYDRHAHRGATWVAWTSVTPRGDECVLSA